jgi:hypothetical protein
LHKAPTHPRYGDTGQQANTHRDHDRLERLAPDAMRDLVFQILEGSHARPHAFDRPLRSIDASSPAFLAIDITKRAS